MGNSEGLCAREVQRMSAGTGVQHSEENVSPDTEVHLLQIWIKPQRKNIKPSYMQHKFSDDEKRNKWCLIVSQNKNPNRSKLRGIFNLSWSSICNLMSLQAAGYQTQERNEGLQINQEVNIFASILEESKKIEYTIENTRGIWIQIIRGRMRVNEREVTTGDGISIENEKEVIFLAVEETEFLLFDLR